MRKDYICPKYLDSHTKVNMLTCKHKTKHISR